MIRDDQKHDRNASGRQSPLLSDDPDWNEILREMLRKIRLHAIMRGSVGRAEIGRWISAAGDVDFQVEARGILGRRGILSNYGLRPLKGGVLIPAPGDWRTNQTAYKCYGKLQHCLESAVCMHDGYRIHTEFDTVHIAKSHTGALKRSVPVAVVGHTLHNDALLQARSPDNRNLMSRASAIAHFFAKRRSYDFDNILHLLVRWWRKGFFEVPDLRQSAAMFGMSKVMEPHIVMLPFVPRSAR